MKLKIEIEKLDRKTMTGSSILKLYPDQHTPILDLLVRESVQNSLDAASGKQKFVDVDFITGNFNTYHLCESLDGISEKLYNKFPDIQNRFLAIKDKYTEGLTGALNIDDVEDYKYGNLIKLVYDICKPQDIAGSGGSWGLGKTIYFRLGIGMVFYYSRIYDKSRKTYQSRLAGILVEDESAADPILPQSGRKLNSGVAWWGKPISGNRTIPITDNKFIKEFLSNFGISPYEKDETGTTIIIPFINEDCLLQNNRVKDNDIEDENVTPKDWANSIESYLGMSVQRWYFPRLNNSDYIYGQYLRVNINGKRLKKSEMSPIFLVGQALYNHVMCGDGHGDEYIKENGLEIDYDEIRLNRDLAIGDCCAGYLASVFANKKSLGMCPPNQCFSPYYYLDLYEEESELNRPIFGFCRKPGMIVSYMDEDPKWTNAVPYSDKDSYIIALFVLNSDAQLRTADLDLEEYVRKSELANHTKWEDYPYQGTKRNLIQKIKKNTSKKLCSLYVEEEEENNERRVISGLGQMMTKLILPPEGFGKKASSRSYVSSKHKTEYSRNKDLSYTYLNEYTKYSRNSMEITYKIKGTSRIDSFGVSSWINSESGAICAENWEISGLKIPYEIMRVSVNIKKIDGKNCDQSKTFTKDLDTEDDKLISFNWLTTEIGSQYGFNITFADNHSFELEMTLKLELNSRDLQPLIKIE